ncbi:response regulator [Candidatus Gottesmanbacteria bacterium]|nr:response regulator [Candidatus Gottesmanbacteria bacterium]
MAKTILIIEDNLSYQSILKEALEGEHWQVAVAGNGREALNIVKEGKPDLIILDLLMPEMDGITFYYQLKKILKKHIPILILTNVSDTAAYGKDIKDVLIKSDVSIDDVVARVNSLL